jgi:hypothetical protein
MICNVIRNGMRNATSLLVALGLAAGMAGCRVNVNKGANGEDKSVQVDTPFGGVHVNTNQTSAEGLGLPVYPGAEQVRDNGKHESADVRLGFGDWQMRVRAVTYATDDSQEMVIDFYKKALGRYGDVVTCKGHSPLGAPAATHEGLTCDDDMNANVRVDRGDYGVSKNGLLLKAGSKRHQHILGFDEPRDGQTRFSLVALDLPADVEKNSGKSD